MSDSKAKKSKTTKKPSTPLPGPQLDSLPVQSIPDFEPAELKRQAEAVAQDCKVAIRALQEILSACEIIGGENTLQVLATNDKTASLGKTLNELQTEFAKYGTGLSRLHDFYESWRSGEKRSRRARFEALVRAMQWKLVGNWPEPVVNGIVFVNVDESKDQATVNGRAIARPITSERLIAAAYTELSELTTHLTPPPEFAASLWKAYRARGVQPPDGIGVLDLLAELTWQRQGKSFQRDPRTESFRGYPVSQFRADLTHYLESQSPPVSEAGKTFVLDVVGGSFAQDGVFMYFPQTDRLATCGRLSFRPADRGGES